MRAIAHFIENSLISFIKDKLNSLRTKKDLSPTNKGFITEHSGFYSCSVVNDVSVGETSPLLSV